MPPLHQRARLIAYMASEVRSYSAAELERVASKQALRSAVQHGDIVRMFVGIYVAGEHQESFIARAHAALRWAGPRAALAGDAALFLWGGITEAPERVHVVIPHGSGRRPPSWVRLTRATYTFPTASWHSFAVVTAEVALIQAYRFLAPSSRSQIMYTCFSRGAVHPAILADALHLVPRIWHRRQFEAVVNAALAGAESHLEQIGADDAFACPELEGLLRQHRIRIAGERFRCDFYDPITRTAVELDGAAFHGDLHARERDIRRDALLGTIGIQTVRFGYRDIVDRPLWCRESLVSVLRSRGQSTLTRT